MSGSSGIGWIIHKTDDYNPFNPWTDLLTFCANEYNNANSDSRRGRLRYLYQIHRSLETILNLSELSRAQCADPLGELRPIQGSYLMAEDNALFPHTRCTL